MPTEPAQAPLGWPVGAQPQIPSLSAERKGPEKRSDFPSCPELSPNWATQSAQRLCPRGQGPGSGSSFPRKAPVPSKWRGPAPHTGPRQELGQEQQISSGRRPRQGLRGGGFEERVQSFNSHLSVAVANSGPKGLAEFVLDPAI